MLKSKLLSTRPIQRNNKQHLYQLQLHINGSIAIISMHKKYFDFIVYSVVTIITNYVKAILLLKLYFYSVKLPHSKCDTCSSQSATLSMKAS